MSRKGIFSTSKGDEHGVTELLREVSQRSCSLTDEERREVSEIVRRVEEHHARGTPMGKLKKKISDNINSINDSINDNISTINNVAKSSTKETFDVFSSKRGTGNNSQNSTGSTSVNEWGKDLLQKMSKIEIEKPWILQKDQTGTTSKPDAKEVFRNFSMKGIQNPLKPSQQGASDGGKDRRPEILKALERSSQSSRDLLQNISKTFQNPLTASPPPAPRATAKTVSDSLLASRNVRSSRAASVPKVE
mmetsp:Transcript_17096/g.39475  ORF Transcript_17096/g.39475 Transcript_17096/m.39475 type:complete len:248 (-) Transcript_17096:471-1214(-)